MATNNMNNLTTLIKRLEAATSRLEDIASSTVGFDAAQALQTNGAAPSGVAAASTPSDPAATPKAAATPSPPKPASTSLPAIEAFDDLVRDDLAIWFDLSSQLGSVIAEQAQAAQRAFAAQRTFLLITTKAKKPDMASPVFMDLLNDTQQEMMKVDEIRQANRQSPYKDHLAMVADGLGALGWVVQDSKPADYIAELFGGAQIYGNKVLQQFKEKDRSQVEWVQAFYKLFKSLAAYVKQHHPNGIVWAKDGMDPAQALKDVKSSASSTATPPPAPPAASGSAPPPPPPPGPPPPAWTPNGPPAPPPPSGGKPAGDMNAVFNDLNRGESVTAGLRKVDPSQMTHKNPSLRAQSVVPTRSDSVDSQGRSKSPQPPRKPDSMRQKKPPRKELDGNKWIVENFDNAQEVVEINASLTQSILITRCSKTTIRVNGKANAISVDNSPRTALVVDSLVSSVDVIKCPDFALQVLGSLPTILLDQVDGAQVYLGQESLGTELFTSKCSGANLILPPMGARDEDSTECPVPEQIRSFVRGGRVVSEIVEHKG